MSISRQAIFSGKRPYEFASSIDNTGREETAWHEFWAADHLTRREVLYWKECDSEENLAEFMTAVSQKEPKVVGVVVGTVDEIAHGMRLGEPGLKQQVRQWSDRRYIYRMVKFLLEHSYSVVLGSDHGNMEAKGCGRLSEGVLAGMRGERVRVYPTELSCVEAATRSPGASAWHPVGLPQSFYPLIAPYSRAFVKEQD
ncbi:MAG TPA: PglZ domain-containing protein, partial [Bryobacteraceae bacterium]